MENYKNIIYKISKAYFILFLIILFGGIALLSTVGLGALGLNETFGTILFRGLQFFMYLFPIALISLLIGRSPQSQMEAKQQDLSSSTESKPNWSGLLFSALAGVFAIPLALVTIEYLGVYLSCLGSSDENCGYRMIYFLAKDIYLIPILIILFWIYLIVKLIFRKNK